MQESSPLCLLYCPFPSQEAAEEAARLLLEERLVACCNLLPAGVSLYWWEGKIERASEVTLLAKTAPALAAEAAARLETLHPYDIPAIIRLEASASADFSAWVAANAKSAKNA